jgi:hypothetical protein
MSQKSDGQNVLKSETLYIAQSWGVPKLKKQHQTSKLDMPWAKTGKKSISFPSESLLCIKDDLALLNMRWYLAHLLKVLHLCWFNKRNNKRILFVDDCDKLISQSTLMSQLIARQWEPKKNMFHDKKYDFSLFVSKTTKKPGRMLNQKIKIASNSKSTNTPFVEGKKIPTSNALGFGSQLLGLIQHANPNPKLESVSHVHSQKSDFGINPFLPMQKQELKTKQNILITCQNSRLSMCSTKSNHLIGLFSNSNVSFKTDYLMLNNLLASEVQVVNRQTWSGFTPGRKLFIQPKRLNPNGKLKTTAYERILTQWYKKELTLIAKSPWKLEADMVFFTNPGKTTSMVEQIKRLGIPTLGLVNGSQILLGSKSAYGLFNHNHCVDYAIIGNANSIYFVKSVLAKCLAVVKKRWILSKSC